MCASVLLCVCAVPRYEHNLFDWDFDVELGNTAEYTHDDPGNILTNFTFTQTIDTDLPDLCVCVSGAGVVSCTFDEGLCVWMSDSGDLHWNITEDPAGKTSELHTRANIRLLLYLDSV